MSKLIDERGVTSKLVDDRGVTSKLLNVLALLVLGGLVGVVGWWTNHYRSSLLEHEAGIAEREVQISELKLSLEAQNARKVLYHAVPKLHYLCHTCDDILRTHLNASKISCMISEDFIGKQARRTSKTHRMNFALRALQRYLICLRQRWKHNI